MATEIEWTGSRRCDFCGEECGETLYDAATRAGPWATMCPECWKANGTGLLGPGFGQRYEKAPDGRMLKAAGWPDDPE